MKYRNRYSFSNYGNCLPDKAPATLRTSHYGILCASCPGGNSSETGITEQPLSAWVCNWSIQLSDAKGSAACWLVFRPYRQPPPAAGSCGLYQPHYHQIISHSQNPCHNRSTWKKQLTMTPLKSCVSLRLTFHRSWTNLHTTKQNKNLYKLMITNIICTATHN